MERPTVAADSCLILFRFEGREHNAISEDPMRVLHLAKTLRDMGAEVIVITDYPVGRYVWSWSRASTA